MADPLTSPALGSEIPLHSGARAEDATGAPQLMILDFFFPGFSTLAAAIQKYLHLDLNLYVPLIIMIGAMTVAWNYSSQYFWDQIETYFMSTVDIRTDDEIYNILMGWVAAQRFSQGARRFVVNTNLNSRSWYLWRWDEDEDEEDGEGEADTSATTKPKKALSYTPSFGTHYFWYKSRLLLFKRSSNREQSSYMLVSEREEISISCFGRDPWVLKELLHEARSLYTEKDQKKTLIYRGTTKSGTVEPTWQRCMARSPRPFSTVILNEAIKKKLVDDVTDYLEPATQRWYSNRGIPYRRGYLLHGPPGTGKSSLSLALAGFFKMRIYIVSLSSITATEESLGTLFAELPRRCVVLLEDIDSAGLTHTREENKNGGSGSSIEMEPGQLTPGNGNTNDNNNNPPGRLSLSGLLNILDGVASQEGRVLIMTTNHLEKLDKALIRPGRVDMIVEFGLADSDMVAAIFKAIFAHLEGDESPKPADDLLLDADARAVLAKEKELKRLADDDRVKAMAKEFAARIPAHEFSPAELQGHLLRHKRDPQAAIDTAAEFVEQARKDRKEKELKEAEEKRKAEEQKKKEEEQKQKDKEQKEKEEAEKKKKEEEEAEAEAAKKKKKAEEEAEKAKAETQKKKRSKRSKPAVPASSSEESDGSHSDIEIKNEPTTISSDAKTKSSSHKRNDSGYGTPASVED